MGAAGAHGQGRLLRIQRPSCHRGEACCREVCTRTLVLLTSTDIKTEPMELYGVDADEVAVAVPEARHPVEAEDVAEAQVRVVAKPSASRV